MRPFWLQQALASEQDAVCPPLQGDARCDVCIVGGGYTGLWTALMLKEAVPALDVLLIEADICGAGASGRNGGCALSWSAKYFTLERLFGAAEAVRLVRESERSIGAIGEFCAANGIDCDYRLDGTLYTATNQAQVGATDAVIAALAQKGINSFERLALDEVQRLAAHEPAGGDALLRDIEADVHKGFGQRTEGFWEYPVRLPFLIRAIALPVRVEGRLAGSIALHWPLDQAPVERVLSLHLNSLAGTVGEVQRALVN